MTVNSTLDRQAEAVHGEPYPDWGNAIIPDGAGFIIGGWHGRDLEGNGDGYMLRTHANRSLDWEITANPADETTRWLVPEIHSVERTSDGGAILGTEAGMAKVNFASPPTHQWTRGTGTYYAAKQTAGGGARGITAFALFMNPEGMLMADVNAVSSDLQLYLTMPSGTFPKGSASEPIYWISIMALPEDETVPAPPVASVPITPCYKMEPAGATFNPPGSCMIKYGLWELPEGADENKLVVMWWDPSSNQWIPLETEVDTVNKTVTTELSHFSLYTVMLSPQPAEFVLSGLEITPGEVDIDEEVTISVLVINTGELSGDYDVVLKVNGEATQAKTVTLAGGDSDEVSFTVSQNIAGAYSISVNELSGEVIVKPAPEPEPVTEPEPTPEPEPATKPAPEKTTEPEPAPVSKPAPITELTEEDEPGVAIRWWIPTAIIAVVVLAGASWWLIVRRRKSSKVETS